MTQIAVSVLDQPWYTINEDAEVAVIYPRSLLHLASQWTSPLGIAYKHDKEPIESAILDNGLNVEKHRIDPSALRWAVYSWGDGGSSRRHYFAFCETEQDAQAALDAIYLQEIFESSNAPLLFKTQEHALAFQKEISED